jgi:hypothetical protein
LKHKIAPDLKNNVKVKAFYDEIKRRNLDKIEEEQKKDSKETKNKNQGSRMMAAAIKD